MIRLAGYGIKVGLQLSYIAGELAANSAEEATDQITRASYRSAVVNLSFRGPPYRRENGILTRPSPDDEVMSSALNLAAAALQRLSPTVVCSPLKHQGIKATQISVGDASRIDGRLLVVDGHVFIVGVKAFD